jgi:hypothetical protein
MAKIIDKAIGELEDNNNLAAFKTLNDLEF